MLGTAMNPRTFMWSVTTTSPSWLDPVRLQRSGGFRRVEIRRIQRLVERNRERFLRSWNAYFND
jgi:hypothetical protein